MWCNQIHSDAVLITNYSDSAEWDVILRSTVVYMYKLTL